MQQRVAEQTIGRLSLYRRLLERLLDENKRRVFSHEIAEITGFTAAQVRRDLMGPGPSGNSRHGYDVGELIQAIDDYLDHPGGQRVAVIGIGNLGRALVAFFSGRRPNLSVVAGFDSDPQRVNRVINGCRIYPMESLSEVVVDQNISVAMIAVPAANAQSVAKLCVEAGVSGILNFAPVHLRTPASVYVSDVDLAMSLEKVAFFARQKGNNGKPSSHS